jgi:hypothetical protein
MSKVTKPIGKMAHTSALILLFLDTIARPARTSEIRAAVCRHYPEAPIYGAIGDLQTAGRLKRITMERDALYVLGAT